jgi:hypothetical protein
LDKFLSKNTSEDNASFDSIISEAEKKERNKVHQAWLHDKEKYHSLVKYIFVVLFFFTLEFHIQPYSFDFTIFF